MKRLKLIKIQIAKIKRKVTLMNKSSTSAADLSGEKHFHLCLVVISLIVN